MSAELLKPLVDDLVATRMKLEKTEKRLHDLESSLKYQVTNERVVAFFIKMLSGGEYDRRGMAWHFVVPAIDLELCQDWEALETISSILKDKVKK